MRMNITIVGAGYVGLVTGISLAQIGHHQVTFVESAPGRLEELKRGRVPIHEPGLDAAFDQVRSQVRAVASLYHAGESPDLLLVAVATPIGEDGEPDLRQIVAVAEQLRALPAVDVSVRSTLPPGTSSRLPELMGRPDGARISTNPEFLSQGSAMTDYAHPSRIVIGRFAETEPRHLALMRELFAPLDAPYLEVSVQAAELIKNVANGFLALKLSFVNEVASLSEEYGVDVDEVLDGIALDPRIGSAYMRPGLGFGGSCLPKELQVLAAAGRRQGLAMHVARAASLVNAEQQERFARRILRELGSAPKEVALLGLSFKAGTDDLRGSPAITVARRLEQAGHVVRAHDPAVRAERVEAVAPRVTVMKSAEEALTGADVAIVATEWAEYRDLSWDAVASIMRGRLVFDGRNVLEGSRVAAAGLSYRGVGRPSADPSDGGSDGSTGASRS